MNESINLDDDINDTIEVHADHQDLNQEKGNSHQSYLIHQVSCLYNSVKGNRNI